MDPVISLAFTIQSNKLAYAILLGSGVSRPSHIPTGWEIVQDLIRKVAITRGESADPEPARWYKDTFDLDPNYSDIIQSLAPSSGDRRGILSSYFEPTPEEKDQGKKTPSAAHHAIAELVKQGYVNVIITTNFDRLMEQALEVAGIPTMVIYSVDGIKGSPPLAQNQCTLIKVHGDYLDTRIKNTATELETYEPELNSYLDRILSEYGLIVCGWSAEWDQALRDAILRNAHQRYTTFWTHRETLNSLAEPIVTACRAQRIRIKDADSFFSEVVEKIESIERFSRPHPLSSQAAVDSLKRYLSEDRFRIQLHDLMKRELDKTVDAISEEKLPVQGYEVNPENILTRLRDYEAATDILISLYFHGCYWANEEQIKLFIRDIEQLATIKIMGGYTLWLNLRRYPALLLFYAGGMGCIASGNYKGLSKLLFEPLIEDYNHKYHMLYRLSTFHVMGDDAQKQIPGRERNHLPLSEHLFVTLRERFTDSIPDDNMYEQVFDGFEYLKSLLEIDADLQRHAGKNLDEVIFRGSVGRFAYKMGFIEEHDEQLKFHGQNWPPLRDNLFGGSFDRLMQAKKNHDTWVKKLGLAW